LPTKIPLHHAHRPPPTGLNKIQTTYPGFPPGAKKNNQPPKPKSHSFPYRLQSGCIENTNQNPQLCLHFHSKAISQKPAMQTTNFEKDGYLFSNDKTLLQPVVIHAYLTRSYWAEGIPLALVQKSMANSACFGVYYHGSQIAFARWITDETTFAYLADVFVLEEHRGKGISKTLMQFMLGFAELQNCRRLMLATRDAHGLYAQFGFQQLGNPDRNMEILKKDMYKK
jgi:GNAT superfamily N-acetyltransferase